MGFYQSPKFSLLLHFWTTFSASGVLSKPFFDFFRETSVNFLNFSKIYKTPQILIKIRNQIKNIRFLQFWQNFAFSPKKAIFVGKPLFLNFGAFVGLYRPPLAVEVRTPATNISDKYREFDTLSRSHISRNAVTLKN